MSKATGNPRKAMKAIETSLLSLDAGLAARCSIAFIAFLRFLIAFAILIVFIAFLRVSIAFAFYFNGFYSFPYGFYSFCILF